MSVPTKHSDFIIDKETKDFNKMTVKCLRTIKVTKQSTETDFPFLVRYSRPTGKPILIYYKIA